MNLKSLALLVGISQALLIVLTLFRWSFFAGRFDPLTMLQLALQIPLVLFFFYVWKRQKP
jgi:nicotinamide riboside transporter PnuC